MDNDKRLGAHVPRVFFVGAGASVDDGFPVTGDLMAALAHTVRRRGSGERSTHRLYEYLNTVYGVSKAQIDCAATAWQAFVTERRPIGPQPLPSIIELLSVLDTVMEEGMSLGPAANPKGGVRPGRRNLDPDELRRIRDRVQRALIDQFAALHKDRCPVTFDRLVGTLSPEDVVITTNWDLLLDRALDARFGPPRDGASFGTPQAGLQRSRRGGRQSARHFRPRPHLLKLHGSLNWLWCMQCGGLTIDLSRVPGGQKSVVPVHDSPYGFRCDCGGQFTGLIVTPTFLKRYQNHHIGAVWSEALRSLISTADWTFIGYSLPEDDVAIRALLLKALIAHRRATGERRRRARPTRVRLVMWSSDGNPNPVTLARYQQICGAALEGTGFWKGFDAWTNELGKGPGASRRSRRTE